MEETKEKYAQHKKLEFHYKMELASELTGRSSEAIRKTMQRKDIGFAEVIKLYMKEDGVLNSGILSEYE